MKHQQATAILASTEAEEQYRWVNEFIELAKKQRAAGNKAAMRSALSDALYWVWSANRWARLAKALDKL